MSDTTFSLNTAVDASIRLSTVAAGEASFRLTYQGREIVRLTADGALSVDEPAVREVAALPGDADYIVFARLVLAAIAHGKTQTTPT